MARRKDVFFVSLWRDGDGLVPTADWRGSVEHVHSRRRLYFRELIDLVAFLAGYMNAAAGENGSHAVRDSSGPPEP